MYMIKKSLCLQRIINYFVTLQAKIIIHVYGNNCTAYEEATLGVA